MFKAVVDRHADNAQEEEFQFVTDVVREDFLMRAQRNEDAVGNQRAKREHGVGPETDGIKVLRRNERKTPDNDDEKGKETVGESGL